VVRGLAEENRVGAALTIGARKGRDMKIKIVRVLFQVEVEESDADQRLDLNDFIESQNDAAGEQLYDAANELVNRMLKNAKKFDIGMKDKATPEHDFDINIDFNVMQRNS